LGSCTGSRNVPPARSDRVGPPGYRPGLSKHRASQAEQSGSRGSPQRQSQVCRVRHDEWSSSRSPDSSEQEGLRHDRGRKCRREPTTPGSYPGAEPNNLLPVGHRMTRAETADGPIQRWVWEDLASAPPGTHGQQQPLRAPDQRARRHPATIFIYQQPPGRGRVGAAAISPSQVAVVPLDRRADTSRNLRRGRHRRAW
jgi:hypothetical protein